MNYDSIMIIIVSKITIYRYFIKYNSVPLELYPSRVFRQAVFHVLGEC